MKNGDCLIPNLTIETKSNVVLGKYSRLRLDYLKEHKRGLYTVLKMKNELANHLKEVQNIASERVESIAKELAKKQNIDEKLKENNQLKWVRTDE
jgi:hypothetical protein